MRLVFLAVLAVLAATLAAPTPPVAGNPPGPAPSSFVVVLKEQRSHDASAAVRAAFAETIDALVEPRNARIRSPADLADPEVWDLSRELDAVLGDMRTWIAAEASRLHEPTRSAVEARIRELGGIVTYRSPLLNLLVARIPEDRVPLLESDPRVAFVEPDGVIDALIDVSVPSIGTSAFWSNGFTGGPFKLIIPDTGVDGTHPALAGKVSDAQTFHDAARLQGDYQDDWTTTDDLHGHGTHIAGNVASQDALFRGEAYGLLGVVNVKFGYRCNAYPGCGRGVWSDAFRGIDWAVFTAGGDVLSLSFGGGGNNDGTDAASLFMDALVDDLGIPVSIAAGNSGPGAGTLGQPATSYNGLTVGAMDDGNTVPRGDDAIAGFSSRGPTGDGRIKPDIVAPGVDITSTSNTWEGAGSDWISMTGTSMAAPHVGAALELFLHSAGGPDFPARSKAVLLNAADDRGAAGGDSTYGWGYLNLTTAWAQRNNVVVGTTAPGAAAFYRLTGSSGDRATLVWQRHVVYSGPSGPTQYWAASNLDLALYDEVSQGRLASSARPRDNVEQVTFPSAGTVIVKVSANGPVNPGPTEAFALAGRNAPLAVTPPALQVTVDAPPSVNSGQNFVITANVTNAGGLRLATASVTLNLPPQVSLIAGANPASLGAIPAGQTRSASWTVSTNLVGVHAFTATGSGVAYEETYVGTGGPAQVTVNDRTPPNIALPSAVPSPQNVGGPVNISAGISDNVAVTGSWVYVMDPLGAPVGNFTMAYDPITGRRFHVRPYSTIGRYDYTISATDAAGNWATFAGAFAIADLEAPVLSLIAPSPNPQEVHFPVNVSGTVTDNVGVWAAYLEVTDPLGGVTNASMTIAGTRVSHERAYDLVGVHFFTVSARDAAWNWATWQGSFLIRDTTRPVADAGPDVTVEAGTIVTLDGSRSTDNVGIVRYTWTFDDNGPWTYVGVTADHRFLYVGTVLVTLTVQDGAGNAASDTMTVTVVDPRPPAIEDVRADPPVQDVGGVVTVSARVVDPFGIGGVWLAVRDPVGGIANASMGDVGGRHASGATYRLRGLYLFEIWAVDVNGNWASASGAFQVADLTPPSVAAAASPPDPDYMTPVAITATAADNDAIAEVWLAVRDPAGGRGTYPMNLVGAEWQASLTPNLLGRYDVTVWATDPAGNAGSAAASFVSRDREPPALTVAARTEAEVLTEVRFTIDASDNAGPATGTFEIRSPGGALLGNYSLSEPWPRVIGITFSALGPFAWSATAVDPSGNRAYATGTVDVQDTTPPIADAGPDRTVVQGTPVPFDASGSSDNFGIQGYAWTFAGEPPFRRERITYTFRSPGTFTVRLTVLDVAGNAAEDTAAITVVPADTDGDGSWDDNETQVGTDPNDRDTDGDGLVDGADPDPLTAKFDVLDLFASWIGVLLLLLVFLAILAAAIARWRRRESPPARLPAAPAPPRATAPAEPPVGRLIPPPPADDRGLPPPPTD